MDDEALDCTTDLDNTDPALDSEPVEYASVASG